MRNQIRFWAAVSVLLLSACGGGGGGGGGLGATVNSPTVTTSDTKSSVAAVSSVGASSSSVGAEVNVTSFIPDTVLLETSAAGSNQLFVSETFEFDGFASRSLAFTAKDSDGVPIGNAVIKIYEIPADLIDSSDERVAQADLLISGITNQYGEFSRSLEWSKQVSRVLVVIDAIGIENTVMLNVDREQVAYDFK